MHLLSRDGKSIRIIARPFLLHSSKLCPEAEKQNDRLEGKGNFSLAFENRFIDLLNRKPKIPEFDRLGVLVLVSVETMERGRNWFGE
jgi:hypothetical protein